MFCHRSSFSQAQVKREETCQKPQTYTQSAIEPVTASKTLGVDSVRSLVHTILRNVGFADESQIRQIQNTYKDDKMLNEILEVLLSRYSSTLKTKEEMIKYTLRKALRWMRTTVAKGKASDPKEGMKVLVQRYFKGVLAQKLEGKDLEDDRIIDQFLPFK